MAFYYIIGIIIVTTPIAYMLFGYIQKINLRKKFKGNYFDWKNENYDFESLNLIRRYWDIKNQTEGIKNKLDDITWNDLDMDYLFFKMNATQSSIGEEYLYAKLRSVSFDEKELKRFGVAMDFIDSNPDIKIESLCSLYILGKDLYNNVHSYIYKIDEQPIKNIKIFYMLMFLPLISIAICFFTHAGFLLVLMSFLINILVYYKNKLKVEVNLNSLNYILKTVYCAHELSKLNFGELGYNKLFASALNPLHKLNRLGNTLNHKAVSDMEVLFEYIKIILMWDFINYNRIIRILSKYNKEFHQIYELVGELDCAIAICEYRKSLEFYSIPQFQEIDNIIYDDVYHPLIKAPIYNSIDWKNNAIITGSNASGKSTFVKALAITMICAQSIYLCFARQYQSKMSYVVTSMAIKDKVYAGESYFIAEIKSLKRILDSINNQTRIVCFIDEILKGTNTIERISSSASILNWLAGKNCIVMVASHDIELTEILINIYDSYHFREQLLGNGILFDYRLYHGFAKSRNAINLLKFLGYGNHVVNSANKLANNFEINRKWEAL